jgi:hypothetical protein
MSDNAKEKTHEIVGYKPDFNKVVFGKKQNISQDPSRTVDTGATLRRRKLEEMAEDRITDPVSYYEDLI